MFGIGLRGQNPGATGRKQRDGVDPACRQGRDSLVGEREGALVVEDVIGDLATRKSGPSGKLPGGMAAPQMQEPAGGS